jgi:hypothetical protein
VLIVPIFIYLLIYLFMVLEIKSRPSHILSNCFTTELHPQPLVPVLYLDIGEMDFYHWKGLHWFNAGNRIHCTLLKQRIINYMALSELKDQAELLEVTQKPQY